MQLIIIHGDREAPKELIETFKINRQQKESNNQMEIKNNRMKN
jgi:hypothetical protein